MLRSSFLPRSRPVRRAATLVPLLVVSAAWSASLVGAGAGAPSAAPAPVAVPSGAAPAPGLVPAEAIDVPASLTDEPSASAGSALSVVEAAASGVSGIPSAALAAYQRAEAVLGSADPDCGVTWQLLAAVGRVESDHGRLGGSTLSHTGLAQPSIIGVPLDGTGSTGVIVDTDGGQLDGDLRFDRAVGPMQFIPSTWSVVGVDADDDGVRNPQDVDDAALAAAVYLCSGTEDLATDAGRRAALYRYNHSVAYGAQVLTIMAGYLDGEYLAVPTTAMAAGYLTRLPSVDRPVRREQKAPAVEVAEPAEQTPAEEPSPQPAPESTPQPERTPKVPLPQLPRIPDLKIPGVPTTAVKAVNDTLTLAEALVQCTLDGLLDNPLSRTDRFDACVSDYTGRR